MEVQEVECRRRLKMIKSPETVKEAELEDFFQAAEKDLRNNKMLECSWKQDFLFYSPSIFTYKLNNKDLINYIAILTIYRYNFDFEKDEPLGGRYEWVKLNP